MLGCGAKERRKKKKRKNQTKLGPFRMGKMIPSVSHLASAHLKK
jgi:hypothetical protein